MATTADIDGAISTLNVSSMRLLAFHPDPDVRLALAKNPFLPRDLATLLLNDPVVNVAYAAVRNLSFEPEAYPWS